MPGTYVKPKVYNRKFLINIGGAEAPHWAEIAAGITSRGNSFTENSEEYQYISNEGAAETEPTTQSVTRTFSGNRFIGDAAQDEIFIRRIYDLDSREVEFMEYYKDVPGANGWKGRATILIADDGSGDSTARETIGFNLAVNGKPQRGTVTVGEDGVPVFAPDTAEA